MTDQMPTREQIAEAIYTMRAGSKQNWHKAAFRDDYLKEADAVLALFPQPTPNAELIISLCPRCGGSGCVGLADCRLCWGSGEVSNPDPSAEPPSIADMAPGNPAYVHLNTNAHCACPACERARDVTPPAATPEEGDRG